MADPILAYRYSTQQICGVVGLPFICAEVLSKSQQKSIEQLEGQYASLVSGQQTYHHLLQQLTLSVHPFAVSGTGFKTTIELQLEFIANSVQVGEFTTDASTLKNSLRIGQIPATDSCLGSWGQHLVVLDTTIPAPGAARRGINKLATDSTATSCLLATPTRKEQISSPQTDLSASVPLRSSGSASSHLHHNPYRT